MPRLIQVAAVSFLLLLAANNCLAAEPGTFGNFYSESTSVNWGLAILFAIAIASAVYTGFATAPAAVTSIGTLIGNTVGLYGVAATNFGLALMGGGAIATGGAGMAAGAALLTAALTFGTNLVGDLAISTATTKYNYQSLVEQSKNLPTLPPPIRSDGSEPYKSALKRLDAYKKDQPINGNHNQSLFRGAIGIAKERLNGVRNEEEVQLRTLLAYLYFATSQYKESTSQAKVAIKLARELNLKWTLPAYIYSVSSMYDKKPDFFSLNDDYFRYSVVAEPDNDLVPILFAQYMSHINLRFRSETSSYYRKVAEVASDKRLSAYSDQILPLMLVNYFVNLKMEQQRIAVLSKSTNSTIKDSPITLTDTEKSLNEYMALLKGTRTSLNQYKIKSEPTSAEKLLIDSKTQLDKARTRLNQLLHSNENREAMQRARTGAKNLLKETNDSLNSAKSAVDQLVYDNVDKNELQRMRAETDRLLNKSKINLAEASKIICCDELDQNQMRKAKADAEKVLNEAGKSIEAARDRLKKFLNKEKDKREQIQNFEKLLKGYESDVRRLEGLVLDLKNYQAQNKQQTLPSRKEDASSFKQFLKLFQH